MKQQAAAPVEDFNNNDRASEDYHWTVIKPPGEEEELDSTGVGGHGSKSRGAGKSTLQYSDDLVGWSVGKVMTSINSDDFDNAFQTLILVNLLLSCLVSFSRVVYLDLICTLCIFWLNLGASLPPS